MARDFPPVYIEKAARKGSSKLQEEEFVGDLTYRGIYSPVGSCGFSKSQLIFLASFFCCCEKRYRSTAFNK